MDLHFIGIIYEKNQNNFLHVSKGEIVIVWAAIPYYELSEVLFIDEKQDSNRCCNVFEEEGLLPFLEKHIGDTLYYISKMQLRLESCIPKNG